MLNTTLQLNKQQATNVLSQTSFNVPCVLLWSITKGGGDGNWLDGSISGLGAAVALPDDGGVELSSVQVDHSEGG